MGRQNVMVVVALVFMAVLGLATAASSPSPSSSPSKSPAGSSTDVIVEPPTNDDQIGTTDDDNYTSPDDGEIAVPGPLGSASSYDNSAPSAGSSEPADSGSTALVVGVTSIAGALLSFLL